MMEGFFIKESPHLGIITVTTTVFGDKQATYSNENKIPVLFSSHGW